MQEFIDREVWQMDRILEAAKEAYVDTLAAYVDTFANNEDVCGVDSKWDIVRTELLEGAISSLDEEK